MRLDLQKLLDERPVLVRACFLWTNAWQESVTGARESLRPPALETPSCAGCPLSSAFDKVLTALWQGPISTGETVSLPPYALDILVCPVCKSKVELLPDESGLKCVSCRRIYPIRDGIPGMLAEEAKIDDGPTT